MIAKRIIPVIEASGGRVLVRRAVRRILIESCSVAGVEMANGDKIWAPVVPSASFVCFGGVMCFKGIFRGFRYRIGCLRCV